MCAGVVHFPFSPVVLAALLLSGVAAAQPSAPVSRATGIRRIEIPSEPSGRAQEVRISPELSTTFLFDSEIQEVELERRESFTLVDTGRTFLRLVPSDGVDPGMRLRLKVRFKDGVAPASAAFVLLVHHTTPEPLVEVYRRKRTVESYRQDAAEAREETRRCHEENERLHAECTGTGGLRGLLAIDVIDPGGVTARDIQLSVIRSPVNALNLKSISSYRSRSRVAVDLQLAYPDGADTWRADGAALTNKASESLRLLPLWQQEALTADSQGPRVIVEAETSEKEAVRGAYTLKLWDAGGKRTVTLGNVTFP